MVDTSLSGSLPHRPRLYFERIGWGSGRGTYIGWLLFGLLLGLGCTALGIATGKPVFLQTCLVLDIGITVLPFAMRFGLWVLTGWRKPLLHSLQDDEASIKAWHDKHIDNLDKIGAANLTGLLLTPWAIASFWAGGYFAGLTVWEKGALGGVIALAAFASGIVLYHLLYLAKVVWQLGDFEIRVEPHPYGICSIGTGLIRCYLVAALIWFLISLSGMWRMTPALPPVVFIGAPALFVIVGSFVICQLPLHRRMVEFKSTKTYQLDQILSSLSPAQAADLTEERLRQVNYFAAERERVGSLPEWPFGWKPFTGLILSALAPISPAVLQYAVSHFFGINL